MKKVAVLFSGDGTNLEHILKNMHKKNLEVVITVTNNPKAKGIDISKEYNVPCFAIDSKLLTREEFDFLLVEKLIQYNTELTILAGFMRRLTPYFLRYAKAINLHPSLLPANKGLNAIERSYYDDSKVGGVSVHWVSQEIDDGDIIIQEEIVKGELSLENYTKKVKEVEHSLLEKAIKSLID